MSESITIVPARSEDVEAVQAVFNHRDIIGLLGGFTRGEQIKSKIKSKGACSVWIAINKSRDVVGATVIAGRPQAHLLKYGEVGVLPQYQRKRIGTALYAAMTLQGMMEGRRLFEDTIVGDNPTQFKVLPSFGLYQAGTLRNRTASGKDICLFQYNLLERVAEVDDEFHILSRVPSNFKIVVVSNHYSDDLFEKNETILASSQMTHMAGLRARMVQWPDKIRNYADVIRDDTHPTDERRKQTATRRSLI